MKLQGMNKECSQSELILSYPLLERILKSFIGKIYQNASYLRISNKEDKFHPHKMIFETTKEYIALIN
jgi:hypothetical protein